MPVLLVEAGAKHALDVEPGGHFLDTCRVEDNRIDPQGVLKGNVLFQLAELRITVGDPKVTCGIVFEISLVFELFLQMRDLLHVVDRQAAVDFSSELVSQTRSASAA